MRRLRSWLVVITLLALVIRGAVSLATLPRSDADPDAYVVIAETLAGSGVYGLTGIDGQPRPTAFRPPLYPWMLSAWVFGGQLSRLAVAFFHTVLGVVTALLIFWSARRLWIESGRSLRFSERAGGAAALLVIIDPILLQQSTEVMTETLAAAIAALVMSAWLWASHRQFGVRVCFWLGVAVSLAFLCRPTFLVWAVLLIMAAFVRGGWPSLRGGPSLTLSRRVRGPVVMTLVVVATVAGWMARNQRSLGEPVWATTHGGYTLLLGNNELFYDYLRHGSPGKSWDSQSFQHAYLYRYDGDPSEAAFWRKSWRGETAIAAGKVVDVTEVEDDQRAYLAARATISRQPTMFVWSAVIRVARLWSPWPHVIPGRPLAITIAVGAYYLLLYIAIALGLWRLGRKVCSNRWWPVPAIVLTLTAVHAVYWSNLRMRAPAMPLLAMVAAAPLADLSLHRRWRRESADD